MEPIIQQDDSVYFVPTDEMELIEVKQTENGTFHCEQCANLPWKVNGGIDCISVKVADDYYFKFFDFNLHESGYCKFDEKSVNISCIASEITLILNDCKTVINDENNSKQHIQENFKERSRVGFYTF